MDCGAWAAKSPRGPGPKTSAGTFIFLIYIFSLVKGPFWLLKLRYLVTCPPGTPSKLPPSISSLE